jgi:hypothetical protein
MCRVVRPGANSVLRTLIQLTHTSYASATAQRQADAAAASSDATAATSAEVQAPVIADGDLS